MRDDEDELGEQLLSALRSTVERIRDLHGLRQTDIASHIGMSHASLRNSLSRYRLIGIDKIRKLMDLAELTALERERIELLWLKNRAASGAIGLVFRRLDRYLSTLPDQEAVSSEYRRALVEYLEELDGAKNPEDSRKR